MYVCYVFGSLRLVDTLYEDYGIYTLIDAHQDTLNGRLCGEGMPTWAFDKALELAKFDANNSKLEFPAPLGFELPKDPESGMPSLDACMNHSFFDYYLTFESQAAWKSLYTQSELHAGTSVGQEAEHAAEKRVLPEPCLKFTFLGVRVFDRHVLCHGLSRFCSGVGCRRNGVQRFTWCAWGTSFFVFWLSL